MTAREVLDDYEQRAEAHHLAAGGVETDGDPYFSMTNWKWTGIEMTYPCPTVRAITDAPSGVTTRTDR